MTCTPYAFTDQQLTDIRRFMGYPAYGNGPSGMYSFRYFQTYGLMEVRLANCSQSEGSTVVSIYLTNLYAFETAIITAAGNLDTDEVAVIKRNRTEVQDRAALMAYWQSRLCAFLGLPPGPGLSAGRGGTMVV